MVFIISFILCRLHRGGKAERKGKSVGLRLAIRCTTHLERKEGNIVECEDRRRENEKIGEGRTRRTKGSRNGEMVME